jgi:hypothetical protein
MSAPDGKSSFAEIIVKCAAVALFVGVFGFVVVIVIPIFMRARLSKASNACVMNLRQIDGAKQEWAVENNKRSNDIPTSAEIAVYLKNDRLPVCPLGGTYILGRVDEDPKCSISTSAWPNDHVLTPTNDWCMELKGAYGALLGRRPLGSSR